MTVPAGVAVALVNAFPTERRDVRLEIALRDLPAGDELDLVFLVRVPGGEPETTYTLRLAAAWSDPAADARRSREIAPAPLALASPAEVAAAPADPVVAERAALQRATAERRAALALDRAGRHAESRAGMQRAVAYLQAAPMSDVVRDDLAVTERYAAYAASAAYGELDHKRGAFHNARRTRGKRDDLGQGEW